MSDDVLKHLFGFASGIYFTVVVMLVLFGISYWRQHHWRITAAFFLVAVSFVCFWLYSLFFQQMFNNITTNLYPAWFLKLCAALTPVSLLILTYVYMTGFSMRSVSANQIIEREKWVVYAIYILTISIMVSVLFVDDMALIAKLLLFGFLVPCIAAAGLALRSREDWSIASTGFGVLFALLAVIILTAGVHYIENPHKISNTTSAVVNILFAVVVVCAGFLSIRYGYMEVRSLFLLRQLDKRGLLSDITSGINNNEFLLNYQPQLSIQSKRVLGAEALIRWHHPKKGWVSPADFIPLAEESGLINHITHWVVKCAIQHGKMLEEAGTPVKISVNFSVKNINPSMVVYLTKMLKRYNYPSALFAIEITESLAVNTQDMQFSEAMHSLSELGVGVSIDDYGTGFSSLSHMQKLDIHELKIDQSFIKDLDYDSDNYAIVFSTLQMARNLKLVSVAEGVEDDKVLNILSEMRCDVAQGYGIAKPMAFDDFAAWLKARSDTHDEDDFA